MYFAKSIITILDYLKSHKRSVERSKGTVIAFSQFPSTNIIQALLDSMGCKGSTATDAEKNASLLITRAGAGDPSAVPSIHRVSSALQWHPGNFYHSQN